MVNPYGFYTYAYLREDGTPYYIGKGKGNRAYRKRCRGVKPPKDKSKILYLKQNILEEEAFKHEIYMISVFGRKDLETGILYNKTNGGDGISGVVFTEETKRKLSKLHKGKKLSNETKKKLSELHKGRKLSEEHIKKIKEAKIKNGGKYNYEIISPKNEIFNTNNLKQFCVKNKLHSSHMSAVSRGKMKHYKRWTVTRTIKDDYLTKIN